MAYIVNTNIPTTQVYTTAGSNGSWATLDNTSVSNSWTIAADSGSSNLIAPNSGTIKLSGENADIDINGVSLKDTLASIQERLALLTPNPQLEKEWEELKALGDAYRKMEADIKSKMKTWDILKKE